MTVDLHAQNQADQGLSTLDDTTFDLSTVIRDIFERGAERPQLTPEDEAELIARAKNFDEAAALRLIYAYAPLLRNAVGGNHGDRRVAEDMRAAAVSAVWEAIAAYTEDGETGFAGLLLRFVRDSVHDAESIESTITVPGRTLRRFYSILEKEDGDVFAAAKIAPDFGMTEEVFLSVAAARYLVEMPDVTPTAHDDYLTFEEHDLAMFALRSITGLERAVAECRYGFHNGEAMTFPAITDLLSRTDMGESIYQRKIERRADTALEKMRAAVGLDVIEP